MPKNEGKERELKIGSNVKGTAVLCAGGRASSEEAGEDLTGKPNLHADSLSFNLPQTMLHNPLWLFAEQQVRL